jgi:hypothetical protein
VGRRNIDGNLGILTSSGWRLNFRDSADVEVSVEGERRRGHAELPRDSDEVARLYENLIEELGLERASRRLSIRINVDRVPTHRELVDAVRRSGFRSSPSTSTIG